MVIEMRHLLSVVVVILVSSTMVIETHAQGAEGQEEKVILNAVHDMDSGTISISRQSDDRDIVVQNAQDNTRPFIHPIVAPDGNGVITEYRPDHHPHQTGVYWGLKRVNERDFFMECCTPGQQGFYEKVSSSVIEESGPIVAWKTVYDLLDEEGNTLMTETQIWSMEDEGDKYVMDLEWKAEAKYDLTIGEFFVGGLFVRMKWYEGIDGSVINASDQRNAEAEAQRSMWADIGIKIDGRDDYAHISMLDHPENKGFPIPWRVDGQLGVGPSRQIMGDWSLESGDTEVVRYRLIVYTGDHDIAEMNRLWTEYATGK